MLGSGRKASTNTETPQHTHPFPSHTTAAEECQIVLNIEFFFFIVQNNRLF